MDINSQIPDQIKEFAKSVEIYDTCEKIGSKFNLLIDQVSEIDSEIRGVLMGINKSSDFSDHIAKRLEIDEKLASQITDEVNNQIFKVLKEKLQNRPLVNPSTVSAVENAGKFTIDPSFAGAQGNRPDNQERRGWIKQVPEQPPVIPPTAPEPLKDTATGQPPANLPIESSPEPVKETVSKTLTTPPVPTSAPFSPETSKTNLPTIPQEQAPVPIPVQVPPLAPRIKTPVPNYSPAPASTPVPAPAPQTKPESKPLTNTPPPPKPAGSDPYKEPIM